MHVSVGVHIHQEAILRLASDSSDEKADLESAEFAGVLVVRRFVPDLMLSAVPT